MSIPRGFRRVSRANPCRVCGKPDWCLASDDDLASPSRALCQRVESARRWKDAGYLHVLRPAGHNLNGPTRTRKIDLAAEQRDLERDARTFRDRLDHEALATLAADLGLSTDSLRRLGIGWAGWGWAFPLMDAVGRVIGIRVRKRDGRKLAIKGGREGLFIPEGLLDRRDAVDRLLIAEGPTDTAAMLDLGFDAVGRPSAQSGLRLLTQITRALRPAEVVIVADADQVGQRGADDTASGLVAYTPVVRIVTPPPGVKDAREWLVAGVTHDDVVSAIEAAPVRRVTVASGRGR
jgi:hypothetical protein